jgi:hypothetical protein
MFRRIFTAAALSLTIGMATVPAFAQDWLLNAREMTCEKSTMSIEEFVGMARLNGFEPTFRDYGNGAMNIKFDNEGHVLSKSEASCQFELKLLKKVMSEQ